MPRNVEEELLLRLKEKDELYLRLSRAHELTKKKLARAKAAVLQWQERSNLYESQCKRLRARYREEKIASCADQIQEGTLIGSELQLKNNLKKQIGTVVHYESKESHQDVGEVSGQARVPSVIKGEKRFATHVRRQEIPLFSHNDEQDSLPRSHLNSCHSINSFGEAQRAPSHSDASPESILQHESKGAMTCKKRSFSTTLTEMDKAAHLQVSDVTNMPGVMSTEAVKVNRGPAGMVVTYPSNKTGDCEDASYYVTQSVDTNEASGSQRVAKSRPTASRYAARLSEAIREDSVIENTNDDQLSPNRSFQSFQKRNLDKRIKNRDISFNPRENTKSFATATSSSANSKVEALHEISSRSHNSSFSPRNMNQPKSKAIQNDQATLREAQERSFNGHCRASTPPGLWDTGMPSTQEFELHRARN